MGDIMKNKKVNWDKDFRLQRKKWQNELKKTPKDLRITRSLLEGMIDDPTGDYQQIMFGINPRTGKTGCPKKPYKDYEKLKHLLK